MQELTPVPRTLYRPAFATWDNRIYLLGGSPSGSTGRIRDFYRYDVATDSWEQLPDIPAELDNRSGITAHALGGRIYATADYGSSNDFPFSVYDIAEGTWGFTSTHPGATFTALTVLDGKLWMYGGDTDASFRSPFLWVYDPAADTWTQRASNPVAGHRYHAMAALGGHLYVAGGDSANTIPHNFTPRVFRYDPQADEWAQLNDLPTGRRMHALFNMGGKLYIAGGIVSGGTVLQEVLEYDPAEDSWTPVDPMPGPRQRFGFGKTDFGWYVLGGNETNSSSARDQNWYREAFAPVAVPADPRLVWLNNLTGSLSAAVSSEDSFISLSPEMVTRLDSVLVENQVARLTLAPPGPNPALADIEVVTVYGVRSDASVWVLRGQEGTSPRAFEPGDLVELRVTAGGLNALRNPRSGIDEILVGADGEVLTGKGFVLTQE